MCFVPYLHMLVSYHVIVPCLSCVVGHEITCGVYIPVKQRYVQHRSAVLVFRLWCAGVYFSACSSVLTVQCVGFSVFSYVVAVRCGRPLFSNFSLSRRSPSWLSYLAENMGAARAYSVVSNHILLTDYAWLPHDGMTARNRCVPLNTTADLAGLYTNTYTPALHRTGKK